MSQMNPLGAIGALDPLAIGIDLGGQLLGLPPEVRNAAKIVVGVMTGDLICAANGAIGLMGNMAETAQTEWKPPEYSVASQGYAPPAAADSTSAPPSGGSSATAGSWKPRGSAPRSKPSEPACDPAPSNPTPNPNPKGAHLTDQDREFYAAWSNLFTNFTIAETSGGWALQDNFLTWGDIQSLANRGDVSLELRNAAAFMLENPDRFRQEMLRRGAPHPLTGDLGLELSDVHLIVREGERRGALALTDSGGSAGGGAGGGGTGPVGGGGSSPVGGGGSPGTGGATPGSGTSPPSSSAFELPPMIDPARQQRISTLLQNDRLTSTDRLFGVAGELMGGIDSQIDSLTAQLGSEELTPGQMQELSTKLQRLMNIRSQMHALVSQLLQNENEMAMRCINNM